MFLEPGTLDFIACILRYKFTDRIYPCLETNGDNGTKGRIHAWISMFDFDSFFTNFARLYIFRGNRFHSIYIYNNDCIPLSKSRHRNRSSAIGDKPFNLNGDRWPVSA